MLSGPNKYLLKKVSGLLSFFPSETTILRKIYVDIPKDISHIPIDNCDADLIFFTKKTYILLGMNRQNRTMFGQNSGKNWDEDWDEN